MSLNFSLILMLLSSPAIAAEGYFGKYMVSAVESPTYQKGLSIGRQSEWSVFETKTEGGFWVDNSKRPGAKCSAFISYSLGIEPRAGAFYVNMFQGVAALSNTDTVLGGHLQFVEDVGLGVRDQEKNVAIGLFYKHISSAGIFLPNYGRDFVGVQVMIPWP